MWGFLNFIHIHNTHIYTWKTCRMCVSIDGVHFYSSAHSNLQTEANFRPYLEPCVTLSPSWERMKKHFLPPPPSAALPPRVQVTRRSFLLRTCRRHCHIWTKACMDPWWAVDMWTSALPSSVCLRETPQPVKNFFFLFFLTCPTFFLQWQEGRQEKIDSSSAMQTFL